MLFFDHSVRGGIPMQFSFFCNYLIFMTISFRGNPEKLLSANSADTRASLSAARVTEDRVEHIPRGRTRKKMTLYKLTLEEEKNGGSCGDLLTKNWCSSSLAWTRALYSYEVLQLPKKRESRQATKATKGGGKRKIRFFSPKPHQRLERKGKRRKEEEGAFFLYDRKPQQQGFPIPFCCCCLFLRRTFRGKYFAPSENVAESK